MDCALISIGDELLIGQTVNTNAAWLGEQLNLLGYKVVAGVVIPDDENAILNALDELSIKADIIIITGGLGPTKDDITIENDNAIAVSLNSVPEIPSIKISGRKTATNISVVAIIANEICLDPLQAATKGVSPSSIRLTIFSNITIASSTTIPIASTNAIKVKRLMEKSKIQIDRNVEIKETGNAIKGTIRALKFPRKR